MRRKSSSGLTLVELIVVVAVLFVLASVLTPCTSNAPLLANMTAVGIRGRDIYVAIERANAERVPLGLPPVWPQDFDPAADTNAEKLAQLDFKNSTDYFRWLHDENRWSATNGSSLAEGFNYSKLAGAGVPACSDRKLTAANNLWTVAKNVRSDMDDIVPVLVTRNVDASSLAARMAERDNKKTLRFDPAWEKPFGDKCFVLVRKGGAVFKARHKYLSWGVVYVKQTFDTTRAQDGRTAPPLKYLTPTREVTPGDKAYAEGAAIAYQMAGGWRGQFKRTAKGFISLGRGPVLFLPAIYLLVFVVHLAKCKRLRVRPLVPAPIIGYWSCHCLMVTFWGAALTTGNPRYAYLSFAALALGVTLALVFQRHDREARKRQIKWLLLLFLFIMVASSLFPAV